MKVDAVIRRVVPLLAAAVVLAAASLSFAQAPAPRKAEPNAAPAMPKTAREYLKAMLASSEYTDNVLGILRTVEDPELVPLYVAYSRSGDKRHRLFATTTLGDLKGDLAAAALLERVFNDPTMAIRSQSLAILMQNKKITPAQLQEVIDKVPDDNLHCLAASGLVQAGLAEQVMPLLTKLSASTDALTAVLCRMRLLGLGKTEQMEPLARIVNDPNTKKEVLELMLNQIAEEKIAPAAELAEKLASQTRPEEVRWLAYNAIAAVSPNSAQKLYEAITKSDMTVFRSRVFWLLSQQKQATPFVKALADGNDAVAALARFELARPAGDDAAAKAAVNVVNLKHPVLATFILDRAKDDIAVDAAKAEWYVPALSAIARNVPAQEGALRIEHEQAAKAAKLLGDQGGEKAMVVLKDLLADTGDLRRAAAAGLLRTSNPAAAALVRPLLENPYEELATTAALAMGRHGHKDALKSLQDIVARNATYRRPAIPLMAAWFILKTTGESKAAVEEYAAAAK